MMNLLFRKCKKKHEQSVREFNLEYERLLLHLRELECELPPLVKAWLYLDKLRLSEHEEMNILSSVNNKYDLKLLQQAAMIHDRSTRRVGNAWDKSDTNKRWGRQSVHLTGAGDDESDDDEDRQGAGHGEDSEDDLVTEEVALGYHEAYMAFQDAKSKYREAMKGRGADPAELKRRSEAKLALAKQRSYCGACKRKGHWHKDPECPLRGGSASTLSTSAPSAEKAVKSVQLCQVYMVNNQNECNSALVTGQSQGTHLQAIADTACSKTVAGHQWYQDYCKMADDLGIPVEITDERERFKFGASRVHESTFAIWARFCIQGKLFSVKVAVVSCQLPLLFSRGVLAQLGMVYRFAEHQVDLNGLKIEKYPMGTSSMGHPTLQVSDFSNPFLARIPIGDPRWGNDPSVRILAEEAYTSDAALSPSLFYPKKLNEVVENMLGRGEISPAAFYRWWRDAKLSKDFWLETDDELIRVHVVPRSTCFDPREWKTPKLRLKQALLSQIGDVRVTEAVQVVSMGVQVHVQNDCQWLEMQDDVIGKHLGPWIGRSRFQRRLGKSSAQSPDSADAELRSRNVAMEHEEGSVGGRAEDSRSGGASQVDSSGAAINPHRAEARDAAQDGEPCHEGHLTDDVGGVGQEGGGSRLGVAEEANEGVAHSHVERCDSDSWGDGAHLRQVQILDVQRGAGEVHDMGHGGGQCQQGIEQRASTLCSVGRGGVASPCPAGIQGEEEIPGTTRKPVP